MTDGNDALSQIQEHRAQIDALDKEIVELLNARTELSLAIRALKPGAHMGLYDPRREEEIFERVYGYNEGPLYNDNLREIYKGILKVMKEMPSL
ncbi:MAG: chorismate mutase [Eggerthellaceae bacterium]|jgi:chorismate mutase|nr:chorismate mutase [Eggerthellaceae bacterium]MDR2721846.1 chorismate mutase [Coriobacteriaceae bacterium]